ncbi:MAG: YfhO family protein [Clostridia bacterium]|nr:YfhO family protein [Clostridia bacterium]
MDTNETKKKFSLGKFTSSFFKKTGNKILEKKHLYPAFLLPVVLLIAVYAFMSIFPFGDRSILTLDMNAQYIYYFAELRDILHGESSLIYTFERAVGGEFLGFFTYYVASPFGIIVALFPENAIVGAVTTMMIIKCGMSGLTFFIYLDKTKKRDLPAFYMFSVMYALCAYAMTYQSNTMWMDALLWLPLVSLGIEKLISEGRFKLFIITLALTVWSNYYIGYMVCIYVFLYFFCYLFANRSRDTNKLNENLHYLRSFIRIAICSVVALLMVAMIIFTAYYSLSFGKSNTSNVDYAFTFRYNFMELFAKMFIGSYDTVRPAGLPNIYCGTLVLVLLPLYFLSRKISFREKAVYTVLVLIFAFSMTINTLDLVWHGFQMPVWLNYRYSFMFSFVLLTMAYKGYESVSETSGRTMFFTSALLLFALFTVQQTVLLETYKGGNSNPTMPIQLVLPSVIFIIVYTIILILKHKNILKRALPCILMVIVCGEATFGAYLCWKGETTDVGWAKRNAYYDYIEQYDDTVNMIYDMDDSFFRFEKTTMRKPNDNFALNIRGISDSTSTMNKKLMTFMKYSGFSSKSHWIKYYSGNEVSDSLFGVKYVITDTKPVSYSYKEIEGAEGKTIYLNESALSIAYCTNKSLKNFDVEALGSTPSSFEFLEYLVASMRYDGIEELDDFDSLAKSKKSLFESCYYYVDTTENCKTKRGSGSRKPYYITRTDDNEKASATYRVQAYQDGSVYMYLPSSQNSTKISYTVYNSENEKILSGSYFGSDDYRMHNVGNFKSGEIFYVKLEFDMDELRIYSDYPLFNQINEENVTEALNELKEGELKITEYSDTYFEGTITAQADEMVFTTIPYDKYWEVYVDGERVDTYTVGDTFLSFDITEGEHTVVMKYRSKPFIYGMCLMGLGVTLLIVMCIFEKKYRLYKEKTAITLAPERPSLFSKLQSKGKELWSSFKKRIEKKENDETEKDENDL